MKKMMVLLAALCLTSMSWADDSRQATIDRMQKASEVLQEIMATPDKGIPNEVMEHAKCIAVVPHLVKGGFVFGAEGGSRGCDLPHRAWMERPSLLQHRRRQLGIADWC